MDDIADPVIIYPTNMSELMCCSDERVTVMGGKRPGRVSPVGVNSDDKLIDSLASPPAVRPTLFCMKQPLQLSRQPAVQTRTSNAGCATHHPRQTTPQYPFHVLLVSMKTKIFM